MSSTHSTSFSSGRRTSSAALYALALLEMHPWVNSPALANSDVASVVMRPFACGLWTALGKACLTQAQGMLLTDEDAAARWAQEALRVSQLCISDRYATRGTLFEAFQGMSFHLSLPRASG